MPNSGAGGPCSHCYTRNSCCWRRGPTAKPILCNACGSRYLVKKSLDGYIPIQQRLAGMPAPKPARSRNKTTTVSAPTMKLKSKRNAAKKLDNDMLYQDSVDSEESEAVATYLTDDSDAPTVSNVVIGGGNGVAGISAAVHSRPPSLLAEPSRAATKVLHITSTAQLNQLNGLSSEDMARLLEPSLRLKPRKPIHPRISVVF